MWARYAAKMRRLIDDGTDLATEARFVDMLLPRRSAVLDVGCGTGSTVAHLRAAGHESYGVDPDDDVLMVAYDRFEPAWFSRGAVADLAPAWLAARSMPAAFHAVTLLGNVLAFLPAGSAQEVAGRVASVLRPGGVVVLGVSTTAGGVRVDDLTEAGLAVGLTPLHRFADWHLGPWTPDSPWSVAVLKDARGAFDHGEPDGMFDLGR